MLTRLKQYIIIGLVVFALYFVMAHHFIFTSWKTFDTLKKQRLTLVNTFYSLYQATPEEALKIKDLRDAGIGEYMVEKGMITEEKLDLILRKIDATQ
jgi:hypothetical protein